MIAAVNAEFDDYRKEHPGIMTGIGIAMAIIGSIIGTGIAKLIASYSTGTLARLILRSGVVKASKDQIDEVKRVLSGYIRNQGSLDDAPGRREVFGMFDRGVVLCGERGYEHRFTFSQFVGYVLENEAVTRYGFGGAVRNVFTYFSKFGCPNGILDMHTGRILYNNGFNLPWNGYITYRSF
ncbi:MAG: hypothetical protein LBR15_04730 [Methanobrevibacter sp.]|nr:hypothetical protein [Candidatus Methanovirga australis]